MTFTVAKTVNHELLLLHVTGFLVKRAIFEKLLLVYWVDSIFD